MISSSSKKTATQSYSSSSSSAKASSSSFSTFNETQPTHSTLVGRLSARRFNTELSSQTTEKPLGDVLLREAVNGS